MWLSEGSHYLYPERAYLMLGIPGIALLFWWLTRQRMRDLRIFFGETLTPELSEKRSHLLTGLKTALLCLAWMLITLALMYPYSEVDPAASLAPPHGPALQDGKRHLTHDVILLVDASASMGVIDGHSGETRLTSAKQMTDELLTQMHGESVALYAFTSELIPEVPLTLDYLFLRLMLRQIFINAEETAGTDFLKTLSTLRAKYWENNKLIDRSLSLVLFSDGGDTEWESLKGESRSKRLEDIVEMVRGVDGLQVIAVGIGSLEGGVVPNVAINNQPVQSALDTELLEALTTTDGNLVYGNLSSAYDTSRKIATLLARHAHHRDISRSTKAGPKTAEQAPEPLYHFPLSLAILSLVAALLIPEHEYKRSSA